MDFTGTFGAVLAANLATVFFVYCCYQIARQNYAAPSWALGGVVACLGAVGLATLANW